jgi:hypothetical protein
MDEKKCLLKEDKPAFKHILEQKIEALKEEIKDENEFFKENGLYNERDVSDLAEELDVAERVLKHLDTIPECGKKSAM